MNRWREDGARRPLVKAANAPLLFRSERAVEARVYSSVYGVLSERPLPPNVAGGSAERAWAMPCSPGVDYIVGDMSSGARSGRGSDTCRECAFLAVTRVDNRTHSRRNRTRSTVNLNEAVTCLTDLEEEHSRSLARSHVACRCTASARSAKPCPAMTNREEYFMQHHASSTHWEEVPCALTLCEYVGSISGRLIHMWTCPRTTYVHPRYTLETTRTLS